MVSAWVYLPNSDDLNKIELASSGDVSPGATNPTENKKAGSWYFIRRVVTVTSANASDIVFTCKNKLSTPVNFDDFKVQPLNSTMTAFVYNQDAGELTHILNNDNLFSRFEYDALGQLKKTYTELFKYSGERPVSSQKYNYKN